MNKEDIPKLAYIEAQILHRASAQGLLDSSVRAVEVEYKLQPGALGTGVFIETRTLSLLYALIVVPKELWELDENHSIYDLVEASWSGESNWKKPTYRFIHHLRNAIAHANFEFSDGHFEFWDRYKDAKTKIYREIYRSRLTTTEMQHFLEVVGSILANWTSKAAGR